VFFRAQNVPIVNGSRALPQNLLGELTVLPRTYDVLGERIPGKGRREDVWGKEKGEDI